MKTFDLLYLSPAIATCFENDPPAGDPPAGDPPAGDPPKGKTFTQDDLNRILADDRRKHQQRLEALQSQLEQSKLSETERAELNTRLEEMQASLRSKEEQAKIDQRKLEDKHKNELTQLMSRAESAERQYREFRIERELKDAALEGEAFNANQVVTLLRSQTKIATDGSVQVEFQIPNETTGALEAQLKTPAEAVKFLKDAPEAYGNLFKSNVVSGIGGNSATGGLTPGKEVDVSTLTIEQYAELRKKNPAALGLRAAAKA